MKYKSMERTCKKCGENRPIDDFPINYIWCNNCSGFKSKYPIRSKTLDISNYTEKGSIIITEYNYEVGLAQLNLDNYIEDRYPGFVYILYNPSNNLHKIGYTGNFVRRYQNLCNSNGCKLALKYVIELAPGRDEPNWFIENFLKAYFKNKNVKGEWFDLNENELDEIEDLLYHIGGDDIYTESLPFLIMDYSHHGSAISSSGRIKSIG